MDSEIFGLATGIGSFPYTHPARALDVIFKRIPELPHWPQLPSAGAKESLVRQYLSPLLLRGLVAEKEDKTPCFRTDAEDFPKRYAAFYHEVLENTSLEATSTFGFPSDTAAGFYAFTNYLKQNGTGLASCLKGQLTGPLTSGIVVTDEKMQPAFYNDNLRDIITRSLCMQIRWQARVLKAFGLPVLLFIDESGLYAYTHANFKRLTRQAIQESLQALLDAAHKEGVMVGIHACAGIDWSLLFELNFDVINIDVYNYFTSLREYAAKYDAFLTRGGILAWGIVPTSPAAENETKTSLSIRLQTNMEQLQEKGVSAARMKKQLLFTPSCGTGTLSDNLTQTVYRLLQEIRENH